MNVVKQSCQFSNEAYRLVTDLKLREVEAAPGRPYRPTEQDRRTAKDYARRLDHEEAKETAARRFRSGRGLRIVALRRPYHVEFVR